VLAAGTTQLCDTIDNVLRRHRLLVGPRGAAAGNGIRIIHETHTAKQSTLLVRLDENARPSQQWQQQEPNIEEIILAYMGQAQEGGKR